MQKLIVSEPWTEGEIPTFSPHGGFLKWGYPQKVGLEVVIMENPIKKDDLGVSLFQEPPTLWMVINYIHGCLVVSTAIFSHTRNWDTDSELNISSRTSKPAPRPHHLFAY